MSGLVTRRPLVGVSPAFRSNQSDHRTSVVRRSQWLSTVASSSSLPLDNRDASHHRHCAELVRRADHDHFLAAMLLPSTRARTAYLACRAFNVELARLNVPSTLDANTVKKSPGFSSSGAATLRFQWWLQNIDEIYRGIPPSHPIALALSDAAMALPLNSEHLKRVVRTRMELEGRTLVVDTLDTLETYAENTASSLLYLGLDCVEASDIATNEYAASHVGVAYGLTTMLRGIPLNADSRLSMIPLELLAKYGVNEESIFAGSVRGSKEFEDIVWEIASVAHLHLEKAAELNAQIESKAAKRVLLPAIAAKNYLERLQRLDFDVYDPSLNQRVVSVQLRMMQTAFLGRGW